VHPQFPHPSLLPIPTRSSDCLPPLQGPPARSLQTVTNHGHPPPLPLSPLPHAPPPSFCRARVQAAAAGRLRALHAHLLHRVRLCRQRHGSTQLQRRPARCVAGGERARVACATSMPCALCLVRQQQGVGVDWKCASMHACTLRRAPQLLHGRAICSHKCSTTWGHNLLSPPLLQTHQCPKIAGVV